MIRVYKENIDLDRFEQLSRKDLSDYQQKNPKNLPTHFMLEKIKGGELDGFDQVTYLRKKNLKIVATTK